jgi:hypothetical protein
MRPCLVWHRKPGRVENTCRAPVLAARSGCPLVRARSAGGLRHRKGQGAARQARCRVSRSASSRRWRPSAFSRPGKRRGAGHRQARKRIEISLRPIQALSLSELAPLAQTDRVAMERRFVYALMARRWSPPAKIPMRSRCRNAWNAKPAPAPTTCGSPLRDSSWAASIVPATTERRTRSRRRALADGASVELRYWSAMMIGITARGRGQMDIARQSPDRAYDCGARGQRYRRSYALYQISQLYLAMSRAARPRASRQSYRLPRPQNRDGEARMAGRPRWSC